MCWRTKSSGKVKCSNQHGCKHSTDSSSRSGLKEYSDWPTIPQLYLEREFVGGCDILMSMHQNGELSKLLEEKQVLVAAEAATDASGSSS